MKRGVPAVAWVIVGTLAGCETTEVPDARRVLLTSLGEHALLPLYDETQTRLGELGTAVDALCAAPTEETLRGARDAWWRARAPWKRTEVFRFGPYSEQPLRLGPKIDFWPARPADIDAVLSSDTPLDAASVGLLGAARLGLPAQEYLLWSAGPEGFEPGGRRCLYLRESVAETRTQVRALRAAWDPEAGGFLNELTEAGRGSERYDTLPMAVGEIANRLVYLVEDMRAEKLGKPLGDATGRSADPDVVESRFSGRALEDLRDNLAGLERVYFGDVETKQPGLDAYLHHRGRDLTAVVRARYAEAMAALDAVPAPLSEAVSTAPEAVQALQDALAGLQRVLQVDVLNALSVTAGFNDNDGD